jgi:hypothetical protein
MMLASRRVTRFKVLNRPLIEARGLDLRDLKQENGHEERQHQARQHDVHVTTPLIEVPR